MGIPIIYVSRFESAGYFDNWMEDVLLPDDTVGLSSAEPTQTDKYRFENTLLIWILLSLLLQLEAGRNFETFIVEYFRHRAHFKHWHKL